jgi:integrase
MLPLTQIDADHVRAWLAEHSEARPTNAALAFRLLRAFLNWCADRPEYRAYVHTDACAARLARDELPKKSAKDDCLQREQLPLWFEHVRKLANPVHSAYLQVLLLTGARREELAPLQWEDCDFQWKSLTIHDKVEGMRTIPLTPYVASLLSALPRRNEFVFSSPAAASGRLQEPRIGHNKALTAAGLPALSLHGLRRSFGTLAEWVECPAGVSAQIMGHKPSAIAEKHYRRRPLDLLRQWHVKIEEWILEQAGITFQEDAPGLRVVKNSAI